MINGKPETGTDIIKMKNAEGECKRVNVYIKFKELDAIDLVAPYCMSSMSLGDFSFAFS